MPDRAIASPVRAEQTVSEKIADFDTRVIAHPYLARALDDLSEWVRHPAGATLGLVFGPTGVGKTTLARRFVAAELGQDLAALRKDAYCVPVALVDMPTTETNIFNWSGFYIRAMQKLSEPLPERKLTSDDAFRRRGTGSDAFRLPVRPGANELGRHFEGVLRDRGTRLLCIDEAQHLCRVSSASRLLSQMETIKALSSASQCLFALFGTYDLIDLLVVNGQLARRAHFVHIPPYTLGSVTDRQTWRSILLTFQQHLPIAVDPELPSLDEWLFEGSLGCVGVLKDWLSRSLAHALHNGLAVLTQSVLEQCRHSIVTLATIQEEIDRGERRLRGLLDQREKVRSLIGLPPVQPTNARQPKAPAPGRGRKPGERAPFRDPVGKA